jgi:hypothetical protein
MSAVNFISSRWQGGEIRLMAQRQIEWNGIGLWLAVDGKDGHRMAQPLVLAPHPEHQPADPFVRLEMPEAQMLMDELWKCGLRPTEGTGSAGALAATQAHLDDMRRLCFEFVGVKGPEL